MVFLGCLFAVRFTSNFNEITAVFQQKQFESDVAFGATFNRFPPGILQ